ncbi:MAG TPA: hypothetical protein VI197_32470 [Polyangiaceae bacterium]
MGTSTNKGASISDGPLGLRTLGWMFVKTVVFCAVLCVIVLGMAEFVSR